MKNITAVHTDVGIKKSTNQDSVFVEIADTDCGEVMLAVVCDGMGGLKKGEVASAMLIRAFSRWFHQDFPKLLYSDFDSNQLRESWVWLIQDQNARIAQYGADNYVSLGTTVVAMLLIDNVYYVINVGDSRAYAIKDTMQQITIDQTVIQREIDMGRMTVEEAMRSPDRNVLLQCVGASIDVQPDFYIGEYTSDTVFMLCSDGFRHVIKPEEFYEKLNPTALRTQKDMQESAVYFTELNKSRNETDNISVLLIRAC